jgi:RHS repeat-associated protein
LCLSVRYIEGQRIVSKLGGGWDNNGKGPLKAGDGKVDYTTKGQKVFDGIVNNLKFLGADGQILTAGKSGKIPPGQINGNGNGGGNNVTEAFRYFYHPDHLGSTSYITDASGEVYQHLEYTAWGETFVEEHSNTERTPYLFNGKELDEETGLYYYGARYYDARTSVWMSVDPMASRYPGWSPYNYTLNNPIKLTDPDGRSPEEAGGGPDPKQLIKQEVNKVEALWNKFVNKVEGLVDKVLDAITPDKQVGSTDIEKKNSTPVPVPNEKQREQVKPTNTPTGELDGNLNPEYNPNGTAKGGDKDAKQVMTQEGSHMKVENPDKSGSATYDTTWTGRGEHVFDNKADTIKGEAIVNGDTMMVVKKIKKH